MTLRIFLFIFEPLNLQCKNLTLEVKLNKHLVCTLIQIASTQTN